MSLSSRILALPLGMSLALGAFAAPALAIDTSGSDETAAPGLEEVRAAVDREDYASAIAALTPIVEADPEDADALNLMGFSLRKSGDYENALDFYLRALAIEPEHLGANEYLGELYVETGETELAAERLEVLRDACGTDCPEYQDLAEALETAL